MCISEIKQSLSTCETCIGIHVGVLEEPLNVAGRCHQQQSMCNPYNMQRPAVPCERAMLRPSVRMMPSSLHSSVCTCFIMFHNDCTMSRFFVGLLVISFQNQVTNGYHDI